MHMGRLVCALTVTSGLVLLTRRQLSAVSH